MSAALKNTARKASLPAAIVAMIAATIALEGGYVNHPADPGGETNMGVTKKVAVEAGYTGPMRQLPREVAESIYHDQYIVAPGYAPLVPLDAEVTAELFDTAVNMGPARPSRWFQGAVNAICAADLKPDGKVGPATIAAFRSCQAWIGPRDMCLATIVLLDARQRAEYDRLVAAKPSLKVFHRGWINKRIGNVDRAKCGSA